MKKVLIFGQSGSGKTTLAKTLAPMVGATVFDGDEVRASYPLPIGFSQYERELHARHISSLCDAVTASGNIAIAATICGTAAMRKAFNPDFSIYCTTETPREWPEKAKFEPPAVREVDLVASQAHRPEYWAEIAASCLLPVFSPLAPTALYVGKWHPFHAGHKALIEQGILDYEQVAIGCRDTNRDWSFERVKQRIDAALREYRGRYVVLPLPNIAAVCYGRDVGYEIRRYDLAPDIEAISGTQLRNIANGQPYTIVGRDREHLLDRTGRRGPASVRGEDDQRPPSDSGPQVTPMWHVDHGTEPLDWPDGQSDHP